MEADDQKPSDDANSARNNSRRRNPELSETKRRLPKKEVSHFVCLVHPAGEQALALQDALAREFDIPGSVRVNVREDFHITLLVLSLQSRKEEAAVVLAMERTKHLGPPQVSIGFGGVSLFGDAVVWAAPVFADRSELRQLCAWREALKKELGELVCDARRVWTPHATLFKSRYNSKPRVQFRSEVAEYGSLLMQTAELKSMRAVSTMMLLSCTKGQDGTYIRCGIVEFAPHGAKASESF